MNYSAAGGWLNILITIASFAFLSLVTFFFFQSGERIIRVIGAQGINIVTRIMGLILAVIGAQLVIEGVYDAIHAFEPSHD
jgi:multiple antibiotic resistance protein